MILSLTDENNSRKKNWWKIKLSAKAKAEIQWWINNTDNSCHHVNISNSDITIYTEENLADGVSLMVYPQPENSGNVRAYQCFRAKSNQNRNIYVL